MTNVSSLLERLSPGERDHVRARPEFVAEIGFTEWTDAGRLRHPRYLGLRHDKSPRQVVREKTEH